MGLIKILSVGDQLILNTGEKDIVVTLSEKASKNVILKIEADRSVKITTVSKDKIWLGGIK